MPAMEQAYRTQDAVLWPHAGYGDDGQPTRGSAVAIKVRWVNKRRQTVNNQGNAIAVDATAVVDREVPVNSVMWLGTLAAWNAAVLAGTASDVMDVLYYNETPDIKGRNVRREVGMAFYKDQLPPTS